VSTCVRSGYCCKKAPCPFGTWDSERAQCAYLGGNKPGAYTCLRYAEITRAPGAELSPAFGAGCSSSLNTDRQLAIERRTENEPC
jgi:hypothetical protein